MPDNHECAHEDDLREMKTQIKDIHVLVCGNGKVGIAEEVRRNTWFRHMAYKVLGVMGLTGVGLWVRDFWSNNV